MTHQLPARIFVSSVMQNYSSMRDAAARGITSAGCQPVRAENFPAMTTSPRTACFDGVASCDGLVLVLGARYGDLAASGLSPTEEEYNEARRLNRRIYAFIERCEREPRQQTFVEQVENYVTGHWRKSFAMPEELEALVAQALKEGLPTLSSGAGRAEARLQRVMSKPPGEDSLVWMKAAWTTFRDEEVIDPVLLGQESFRQQVLRIAHSGDAPLLSYTQAKDVAADVSHLVIRQGSPHTWREGRDLVVIDIYCDGTLGVSTNVTGLRPREFAGGSVLSDLNLILRDDVGARAESAWGFAAEWWKHIDPYGRHDPLLFDSYLYNIERRRFAARPVDDSHGIIVADVYPENPARILERPRSLSRADLSDPQREIGRILEMIRRRLEYRGS